MPRETAWRVLRSGSETPMREVERFAWKAGLELRDRGLLRKIVGTEVRRRGTLRALVNHFAKGKPKPDLAAHLRVGLAQLFFLDQVPVHAAVSESVRATTDTLGQSKGRYVNAVLRSALRARRSGHSGDPRRDIVGRPWHLDDPIFHDPREHPLLWAEDALSIPANLMKRWTKELGQERAFELARVFLEEPELSLRVLDGEREGVLDELLAAGVEARLSGHERTLLAPAGQISLALATPAFTEGRLSVQGQTAQRAAEALDAGPGDEVLDLCAAPGGKTAVLLAAGARVLAVDVKPERLEKLERGLARFAFEPGQLRTRLSDGTRDLEAGERGPFDAVLVDAPCSNTGVLGARPGARWRFGPAKRRALAQLQARLLAEGAAVVRAGGRLVYSTCSIEADENQKRVQTFLRSEAGAEWELEFELESLPAGPGGDGPIDGGYAARLRRR